MKRSTIQGCPGLYTAINPEVAPAGSLAQALGVVIKRPGVIQKERPFRQWSYAGDSADLVPTCVAFDSIGAYYYILDASGRICKGGNSGVFTALTLPFTATQQVTTEVGTTIYDPSLHTAQANGNWYLGGLTKGLLKIDTAGGTPYRPGCPKGLDPILTLVAAGSLLANTQSVAYRIVWKRIDANNNLVLGAPSGRAIATATAAQNVSVKAVLPPHIVNDASPTSYYMQVYRSLIAAGTPDDELALVWDAKLTATDVANGFATFVDNTPDFLRGALLYTNPSQQGIGQANDPPPTCWDIAYFKGSSFLARTTQKHRAHIAMLGPPEQWAIQSIAANTPGAGQSTYTFLAAVDLTGIDNTMKLAVTGSTAGANDGTWAIVSINNVAHTVVVTNAGVAQAGVAGTAQSGRILIAGTSYFPIYAAESVANKYYTEAGTTTSTARANASASLVRIINQQTTPSVVAYIESGPDDPPGLILVEESAIGGAAFTLTAFGTTTVGYQGAFSNKWAPAIPITTPLSSINDTRKNGLQISKSGQPEHFPIASIIYVGSQNSAILRITPLREALLVWKEDGLFRVTGSGGNFSWSPYDPTQVLIGRSFVATIANQAVALTRKGLFMFSEVGFKYVSGPVADVLSRYTAYIGVPSGPAAYSYNYSLFYQWGLSVSETDGMVYLYLSDFDALNPVALSYGISSGAWTGSYCGVPGTNNADGITGQRNFPAMVFTQVNGVRVGMDGAGNIFIEDQWNVDADPQWGPGTVLGFGTVAAVGMTTANEPVPGHKYMINVTGVNAGAKQITATALTGPALAVGSLVSGQDAGPIYKVTAANAGVLTLALAWGTDDFTFNTRAYQYVAQPCLVEWNSYSGGDEALVDQWAEVSAILDSPSTPTANSVKIGFWTENSPASSLVLTPVPQATTYARVGVSQNCQYARKLSVRLTHQNALEYLFIKGISYEYETQLEDRVTN